MRRAPWLAEGGVAGHGAVDFGDQHVGWLYSFAEEGGVGGGGGAGETSAVHVAVSIFLSAH